jgi:hypothetical protein
VKIKRAFSVVFILLSLACSSVGFSQTSSAEDKTDLNRHYVEFSQNISSEFCEDLRIALSEDERPGADMICDYSVTFKLKTVSNNKYQRYFKNYLSEKSAKRLFIDFGAIII